MPSKINLSGKKYGRLTVIKETSDRSQSGCVLWECICECGEYAKVGSSSLRNGHTKSCGCYQKEQAVKASKAVCVTHGLTGSPTYISWVNMKNRCFKEAHEKYARYGGRGITVCDRWMDFQLFLEDMGEKPTKKHQIDRKNNNGGYEKENCEWATGFQQQQNRENSRWWYIDGVRYKSSGHAARSLGINSGTVFNICKSGKPGCYTECKYHD